jgi:hypothetical protein
MFCPNPRRKQAEEAAKHPTTTTTSTITIIASVLPAAAERYCPPLHPPQTITNGQETKFYLSILSLTNAMHGRAERASPMALANFDNKFSITIFPTGGQPVSYGYLTWQMGNCKMLLSKLCSPCRSFHSVCRSRSSPHLNLLTSAFIAPRSTIQGIISHPTNFILPLQQKAIPPAMQSCLPPFLWPSHSQVAAACLCPPPQLSHRLPAGTTTAVTTQATLTPLGLTAGKVTGRGLIAILADPAMTQATLTPPGLIPGKATGLSKKSEGRESGVSSSSSITIWRRTIAMVHKAAAAAAQANKNINSRRINRSWGFCWTMMGKSWL